MDKTIKNSIIENVSAILNETFSQKEKQKISEYEDRINFACPYCGDSTNTHKKRGNIYLDNLTFHCFNCGHHGNYVQFLKDFDMSVGEENLEFVAETIKRGTRKKHTTFDIELFNILEKLAVSRETLKRHFRLSEITKGTGIYEYLAGRCVHRKLERFLYNSYHNELWILNFGKSSNITGVQIRSFDESKVKYRTYNISKIYNYIGREMPKLDDDTLAEINKISITFNIMSTDLFAPIYVFEGAIDAMFLKNSIGICGVNRNYDLVENLPETRYFFDNDKAGFERTMEKLNDGKKVFMWKKFLDDLGITEQIKDFNDLIVYMLKNKISFDFNNIENYFTDEKLDLINI